MLFLLVISARGEMVSAEQGVLATTPPVLLMEVQGAVGPAVSSYIHEGLEKAREHRAPLVILQLDTPGGLDHAMRDIIQDIFLSQIPVATYVAPDGSRAASAGTYILYASHIAAMAPATNLGAATPIQIGGAPGLPGQEEQEKTEQETERKAEPGSTLEKKIINDAAAYIRSLAERHGRNGDWAERAVRESVSLTASEALELGVIDIVASSIDDLLRQVQGRQVAMEGQKRIVDVEGAPIQRFEQDWRTRILIVISDPNVAYILMLLGMYGLIFELANPGYILPGVIGGICLLLALYTFQILPINYAGLALLLLGVMFMVTEAFIPSFGALGVGGIIAFVIGSFILVDEESMRISLPIILGTASVSAAFFLWVLTRLLRIRRSPVRTGSQAMLGATAEAMDDFVHGEGYIWMAGEAWRAVSHDAITKGQKVRIISHQGLLLRVVLHKEEL